MKSHLMNFQSICTGLEPSVYIIGHACNVLLSTLAGALCMREVAGP